MVASLTTSCRFPPWKIASRTKIMNCEFHIRWESNLKVISKTTQLSLPLEFPVYCPQNICLYYPDGRLYRCDIWYEPTTLSAHSRLPGSVILPLQGPCCVGCDRRKDLKTDRCNCWWSGAFWAILGFALSHGKSPNVWLRDQHKNQGELTHKVCYIFTCPAGELCTVKITPNHYPRGPNTSPSHSKLRVFSVLFLHNKLKFDDLSTLKK